MLIKKILTHKNFTPVSTEGIEESKNNVNLDIYQADSHISTNFIFKCCYIKTLFIINIFPGRFVKLTLSSFSNHIRFKIYV